jgi:hypothetical protein
VYSQSGSSFSSSSSSDSQGYVKENKLVPQDTETTVKKKTAIVKEKERTAIVKEKKRTTMSSNLKLAASYRIVAERARAMADANDALADALEKGEGTEDEDEDEDEDESQDATTLGGNNSSSEWACGACEFSPNESASEKCEWCWTAREEEDMSQD